MTDTDQKTEFENAVDTHIKENIPTPETEPKDTGPRLGIIHRQELSGDDYHRMPGISKTGLDKLDQNPEIYLTNKRNPKPGTPAMDVGQAYHHLILEPETFNDYFAIKPQGAPSRPSDRQIFAKKQGQGTIDAIAYWEKFDTENAGKTIISGVSDPSSGIWGRSDWDTIHYMRDALLDPIKYPDICVLMAPHLMEPYNLDDDEDTLENRLKLASGGPTEETIFWIDKKPIYNGGLILEPTFKLSKIRLDKLNTDHNLAVDLKTTLDASLSGFARSAHKYRYHVQHAMYMDGWRQHGKPLDGFVFVCQEKEPPYCAAAYELDKAAVELGVNLYRKNMEKYAECHNANEWPGYDDKIRALPLPAFTFRIDVK